MDKSKEFIKWLYKKLNIKSDQELKQALEKIGDKGIKLKYQEFQKESMENETESMKEGGKLSYLKCLREFKKGGKIKNCGCGGNMKKDEKTKSSLNYKENITKAQFGSILKMAGNINNIANKVGMASNIIGKVGTNLNTNKIPMMATQTVSTVDPAKVPGNSIIQQTVPKLNERTIPNVKMENGGEINKSKVLKKTKKLKK